MLKGGQDKTKYLTRQTIFEKRICLLRCISCHDNDRASRCNGLVGTIALKISLGDSCSIGTVSVECGLFYQSYGLRVL